MKFRTLIWVTLVCTATIPISSVQAARLFILSGQSNMANWSSENTFRPTLEQLFPGEEIIIAKYALGGQSIVMWYDSSKPLNSRPGPLFRLLLEQIQNSTQTKVIDSVSFIWMQGEQDTFKNRAKTYKKNLLGLISTLQQRVGKKLNLVLGRINDFRSDKYWNRVRSIQMGFLYNGKRVPWVNTDDLNGTDNGLHLTPDGYLELGRRFADAAARELNPPPHRVDPNWVLEN